MLISKGVEWWGVTMSVPYTGDVILISQKCCPSASSLEPRMAAVPQLYSEWKLTLRLSQLSNVAVDRLLASQTQSNSGKSRVIISFTDSGLSSGTSKNVQFIIREWTIKELNQTIKWLKWSQIQVASINQLVPWSSSPQWQSLTW